MKSRTKLDRSFFSRPVAEVAQGLLGQELVFGEHTGTVVRDTVVEVEAYLPSGDAAAHVYRGQTPRTAVLYGPPGFAYLYLNYGMHWLLNIAAEAEGVPGCVLIRATRRYPGPGLLTRAFGLNGTHYGWDCCSPGFHFLSGPPIASDEILTTPRIGIRHAAALPLRFVLRGFEPHPKKSRRQ